MERPVSTVGLENRESSGATLSWMNIVLGSARAFAVERRVALLEGVGSTRAKGRGVGGYIYVYIRRAGWWETQSAAGASLFKPIGPALTLASPHGNTRGAGTLGVWQPRFISRRVKSKAG